MWFVYVGTELLLNFTRFSEINNLLAHTKEHLFLQIIFKKLVEF